MNYRGKTRYYTKFIDNILMNTEEEICIVHEDNNLPSIQKLKDIYSQNSRITWQSSTLVNDMNTLIRAKTLLTSAGTFSAWIPYILSDTLQTICSSCFISCFCVNDNKRFTKCSISQKFNDFYVCIVFQKLIKSFLLSFVWICFIIEPIIKHNDRTFH